jgi:hypothetical protein
MQEYIICRQEKDIFSNEHVIPDSLGGYYHINTVCKKCNSNLGNCVDVKLIKHLFAIFQRYNLGLKGKNGHIPNPFSGTHTLKNDKSQKVRLEIDNDGQIVPYLITKQVKNIQNNKEIITLTIDKKDSNKLPDIINKIAKRNNIKIENINIKEDLEQITKEFKPEISMELSVDFEDFKIGLLKIAYEFAVDSIEEYYDDSQAIEISQYLKNCKIENNDIFIGSGLNKTMLDSFKWMLNIGSNKHYLVLVPTKEFGLICMIYLSNMFSIAVILSKKEYLHKNCIFGINDIDNKQFDKYDINELMDITYYPSQLRLGYYFNNRDEVNEFRELERLNQSIFNTDNIQPLYNKVGTLKYNDISDKINISMHTVKSLSRNKEDFIDEISFEDEELYIKIKPTNKLVRVITARNERIFKKSI